MANLKNALVRESKSQRKEAEKFSAVTEAQRMIANDGAEDMQMLRDMGMAASVEKIIHKEYLKIELENLEKTHGEVFTKDEIKKVACNYALRFLRSDRYKGNIDPEMLQKMKAFFAKGTISKNSAQLGYNCYILAPESAFNLENKPPKPRKDPDPILFYKLDENHYRLIHKWGADLNLFRRFIGWRFAHKFNWWITAMAVVSAMAFLLVKATLYFYTISNATKGACLADVETVVATIVTIIVAIGGLAFVSSEVSHKGDMKVWSEVWNSDMER